MEMEIAVKGTRISRRQKSPPRGLFCDIMRVCVTKVKLRAYNVTPCESEGLLYNRNARGEMVPREGESPIWCNYTRTLV